MFCGDPMLDIDGVENKTTAYTYRIKAGEGTTRDVTCVLNAVPIYTPHDYILSRARYTAEEVAGDITGELHPLDFVEANFDIRRNLRGLRPCGTCRRCCCCGMFGADGRFRCYLL